MISTSYHVAAGPRPWEGKIFSIMIGLWSYQFWLGDCLAAAAMPKAYLSPGRVVRVAVDMRSSDRALDYDWILVLPFRA